MRPIIDNSFINLIYGFLLGNSFIFKNSKEIKLIIKIEGKHISFMKFIFKQIYNLGYCEQDFPKIITKLCKKGKLNKIMTLQTYNNYNYLNLFNKWYIDGYNKNIPKDLVKFFNEESLAIWLMTEGKISNKNLYVNIKNFYATDIKFLIQFLEQKFKLKGIIFNNNCLEFNSNNIKKIYNITKRYIHPSMKFKFII